MEYTIIDQSEEMLDVELIFEPSEFEGALIDSYRVLHPDVLKKADLMLLSTESLIERTEDASEVVKQAIEHLIKREWSNVAAELGADGTEAVNVRPLASELREPLRLEVQLPYPSLSGDIIYRGLEVPYNEVVLDGTEVASRLERARQLYGVDTDEELIGKIGSYANVAEMREALQKAAVDLVDQMNDAAKRQAAEQALVVANPGSDDPQQVDRYVEEEIAKLRAQMGQDAFEQQGFDMTSLRAVVRRDVAHKPQLNRILSVLAHKLQLKVSDEDRKREVERARAQSVKPDGLESVDETLAELARDTAMREALDAQVLRTLALERVMKEATFTVRTTLTLTEAAPQFVS